eukprot:CAMPEP_0168367634 /NCGR_PEP_ID=MMETSP0228-20121227/5840_1 /TAXON_ID=133427 /ORGANISM="Protoceratium reticulatum, Strain CCCM 535 (=CCMP 1889)" /LENGTH=184 /DNA_ID=CAMNT_0008380463 /DNA_START=1360 /DNA_END=1912 /DNA_ORIENTATION=-
MIRLVAAHQHAPERQVPEAVAGETARAVLSGPGKVHVGQHATRGQPGAEQNRDQHGDDCPVEVVVHCEGNKLRPAGRGPVVRQEGIQLGDLFRPSVGPRRPHRVFENVAKPVQRFGRAMPRTEVLSAKDKCDLATLSAPSASDLELRCCSTSPTAGTGDAAAAAGMGAGARLPRRAAARAPGAP